MQPLKDLKKKLRAETGQPQNKTIDTNFMPDISVRINKFGKEGRFSPVSPKNRPMSM